MDDNEYIIRLLGKVLKMLEQKYKSSPDEVGVQRYLSGVITIYVKNEPMFWFFDEYEFAEWLRSVESGIH